MWIGVLWAGLWVGMWITHVGGKCLHGLLEKSLSLVRQLLCDQSATHPSLPKLDSTLKKGPLLTCSGCCYFECLAKVSEASLPQLMAVLQSSTSVCKEGWV